MSDLSEIQASQSIKVAGADPSTGVETFYAQVDSTGKLQTSASLSGYSYSSYSPDPSSYATSNQTSITIDAVGRLESHATCTTDEGSFRDDFTGSALSTTLPGTLTFTNGSVIVTGVGTTFTDIPQYIFIKKSTDSDALYCEIDHIGNDSTIYLTTNYAGTTASGVTAVVSNWFPTTGTGGSIAVSNSVVSLNSGTTSGTTVNIFRGGDFLPYTCNMYLAISQRIANQTTKIGLMDAMAGTSIGAYIQFDGTTNTSVKFITQSSAAAADTQTTTVTLPGGALTSSFNTYKIDLSGNFANLLINGIVSATNTIHIPGPYDNLNLIGGITNTAAAASTTALQLDMLYFYNTDRVQIDDDFSGDPLNVSITNSPSVTLSGTSTVRTQDGFGNPLTTVTSTPGASEIGLVVRNIPSGTQAISASALPLPTGASTETTLSALNTKVTTTANGIKVDGSAVTQPVLVTNGVAPTDGTKTSYSAAITGLVAASTATDIFTITGSASKIVRITRVEISGTQTTGGIVPIILIRRSTANTAGTSTAPAKVTHDTTNPTATATVLAYTANPTVGTLVGPIRSLRAFVSGTTVANNIIVEDFGIRPSQAIVLRGTAEVLAVNLNSTTVTGSLFNISIEWTEE
jgi:hypothetical protein